MRQLTEEERQKYEASIEREVKNLESINTWIEYYELMYNKVNKEQHQATQEATKKQLEHYNEKKDQCEFMLKEAKTKLEHGVE